MNKKSLAAVLAVGLALTVFALSGGARTKSAPAAAAAPFDMLPPSDLVAFVNVKRLITEAAPKVFADSPEKLAEFNAEIDGLKTRTGIDARSFDSIAVGMRYQNPAAGVTTADTVVVAQGSFDAGALLAAGRLVAKGKYQEQKYKDATVYVFGVNDQVSVPGLMNLRVRELAVVRLGPNALAFGELPAVRAALDARGSRPGAANADLVRLATRQPGALMGFGANVPPSLSKGVTLPSDELNRLLGSIRQAYGSVGTNAGGFDLTAIARTEKADDAKTLSETLTQLKQVASVFSGQLSAELSKLAQGTLDTMKISAEGNETSVSFRLHQADISTLLRLLKPKTQSPQPQSQNQE